MSLVEYPDSDVETGRHKAEGVQRPTKRRKLGGGPAKDLPPLPASFNDLYPASVRVSNNDDPDLHDGRLRSVPHVPGNWSAHVYLEWVPSLEDAERLDSFLRVVDSGSDTSSGSRLKSLTGDDFDVPRPLHMSLSAPLILRREKKDDFLDSMKRALEPIAHTIQANLEVEPHTVVWHSNAEATRAFLVIKTTVPDDLWRLLQASNDVAARFGCQMLYDRSVTDDMSYPFHISIAWTMQRPGDPKRCSTEIDVHAIKQLCRGKVSIVFDRVKIRLGQDVTCIPFRNSTF